VSLKLRASAATAPIYADAAQISVAKRIHLNLVMVKLLELHHLGYDLRHYHAQHHAFIKQFNLPAHFQFDVAAG